MQKMILLFMFCCLPKVMAQKATVTTGGNAIGSGGTVSYSVGQAAYRYVSGSNGDVNQGVQQPYEIELLGADEFPEITLMATVYPNPTASLVNLSIANHPLENLYYQLFDVNGRQLSAQKITHAQTQIGMENLASAIYILNVSENNQTLKSFKIIKNN